MATDNDKGLYLPLKIDLNEWEKSLTAADADLQKAMREMRAQTKDLSLKYDIQIANARTAGNELKAVELENKKLNAIYNVQKQSVEALNRAYQKSVKEKGADATATKALAQQLVNQSRALERTKNSLNAGALDVGKRISDELAASVPVFAQIRGGVASVTSVLGTMGGAAATAGAALGGIGLAAAGIGAVVTGLNAIKDGVNNIALAGRNASDPIYQLRESLQSSYKDAEYIYGVTKIDGSNAESLANALVKLDAALKKDTDGTGAAALALKRYGAELVDSNGKVKSYKEQLQELSRAARTAAEACEYADFKAALPGAFRSTEFDHLLLGLDDYAKKAVTGAEATEIYYEKMHKLSDAEGALADAQGRLAALRGGLVADEALKNIEAEINALIAEGRVLKKNEEQYATLTAEVGKLTRSWVEFKSVFSIAAEQMKADIAGMLGDFTIFGKKLEEVINYIPGVAVAKKFIQPYFDNARKELNAELAKVEAERKAAAEKQNSGLNKINENVSLKKDAEARAKAYEKFNKELRDSVSTDYEKQINALKDKRKAYIDSGIAEVDADRLFTAQKEAIDKQYFDKLNAEREKQAKTAEDAYKREVEAAKRAREASISEAESTLKNNLKLVRYIEKQRKAGTYNEDAARAYADRLYMKQAGIRTSDITALQDIGVKALQGIANARDRLFGQFASVNVPPANTVTNNNNITVNFDNTILDNVTAMDLLANKVANIILPEINRASANTGGNAYGYSN